MSAYLLTYPHVKSREVARKNASRTMAYDDVEEEIVHYQEKINEEEPDTIGQIREALKTIAFANIGDFLSFGPGQVTLEKSGDHT